MLKRKRIREKGKVGLSRMFQEFKIGDKVILRHELSLKSKRGIPKHFRGNIGEIIGQSGKAFVVKFLNGKSLKKLTVVPIHLKKLK